MLSCNLPSEQTEAEWWRAGASRQVSVAPQLYTRVRMFMRTVVASRSFFSSVADTVCSAKRFSASSRDLCWNGTALAP